MQHVLGPLEHFVLVVDSNRVLADLGWLTGKRRSPGARTALQELHASGTVSLFAPEQLVGEVEDHLADIAPHYRTTVEALRSAWVEYRTILHFIPASHLARADDSVRDPKDVPFLLAKDAVGARAIISKDKDIAAMAGLMVAHETLRIAVDYVRHGSKAAQGRFMVLTGLGLVGGLVYGAWAGAVELARLYMRLPRWLKIAVPLALVTSAVVIALHPGARRRLREARESLKSRWPEFKAKSGEAFEQFWTELSAAEAGARNALGVVRQHVPSERKGPTLRQLAYRVCVAAGSPISEQELAARLRLEGYQTKSKRPAAYLRQVLRADGRFRESPGVLAGGQAGHESEPSVVMWRVTN